MKVFSRNTSCALNLISTFLLLDSAECFLPKRSLNRYSITIDWLEIRIMCQSGATCLPPDYCISEPSTMKI
jgi:hypothetical protein